jgi:hypothetical protein
LVESSWLAIHYWVIADDGSIVIFRNVLAVVKGNDEDMLLSAAAGMACRLLQTAGCKLASDDDSSNSLCVMVATTDQGAEALSRLCKNDLDAIRCLWKGRLDDSIISTTARGYSVVWKLQPCHSM